MKTKICGITREKDIEVCQKQDVDLIGFINIKRSPRFVCLDKIRDLTSRIEYKNKSVLIMETDYINEVKNALKDTGINRIQLHSPISDEIRIKKDEIRIKCGDLRKFKEINPEIKIIKAIGIPENIDKQKIIEIKSYAEVCDSLLFDSEIQGKNGGTGKQMPLKMAIYAAKIAKIHINEIELFLAGGINFEKIKSEAEILNRYFDYVDVNSGVEKQPGIKDEKKIIEFMQVIK